MFWYFAILLFSNLHFFSCVHGEKKPLYIGVLLELSESWYQKYTHFFPTMFEYAFERIYDRSDILADYEFKLVIRDTKGEAGLAAKRLTEMLEEDPPKVAVIGPTLSDSLTVTGQIVPFYNVIELSYIAITATTVDRDLFSTLFKVNQVTDAFNPQRIKMMKYFGWTRVGTITYQEEISFSQIENFHGLLRENNMTLVTSAVISDTSNVKDILKRFKEQFGVRIIVAAFRTDIAPRLFCEAYHQGMYGNSHVWILSGPTVYRGWIDKANIEGTGCSKEEIIKATQGYFTNEYLRLRTSAESTVSGQSPEEVMNAMGRLVSNTKYAMSSSAAWVYDTPWALAIGLNNSIKYLERSGLQLHNYNYSSQYLEAVVKGMREVNFQGVSGPVAFDETGSRVGITFIQQNFYEVGIKVASYDEISDNLTWLVDSSSLWAGNEVPQDRFTYKEVIVSPSRIAFGLIISLDCGGCILSFTFLFFNIYYRNNRIIKMSSPMVNNVIIAGCLLMYLETFVIAIDYNRNLDDFTGNSLCMVRIWLLSLAFTTLFGSLFSKTYRVYVVFRDYKFKKKAIKDYHLFGMVGIMLVIDVSILIPWTVFYPLEKAKVSRRLMDESNSNMIYYESYLHCYNEQSAYWISAIYVYKGLLLAFGTFLAWETRHITVPMLNDSKFIGACIYNVVIACIFGVPLAHVLPKEQMTLTFVLESSLLLFCTTITQCIIFIPKVSDAIRKGSTAYILRHDKSMPVLVLGINPELPESNPGEASQLEELKEENNKLRMEAANEAIAIARLRKSLLHVTGNVHFYKSGREYVVCKSAGLMSTKKISLTRKNNENSSV
ncbi:gamma-aminobutyric acid type B receptor subunit 2-like [Mercenaria mercenaria]|uniref:gamma-aminobutyric acid type B receptor subunit 2-like n=1 Tax=Mercenaria mercenaria TaxID=6596 RepID=UPI00234FB5CD|nr:gamma-aminobutyric acid type B receptor subunit 2-like [Mercenaria mercenaria]